MKRGEGIVTETFGRVVVLLCDAGPESKPALGEQSDHIHHVCQRRKEETAVTHYFSSRLSLYLIVTAV